MTKTPHPSSVDKGELLPCPWCNTTEHLSYQWPGSMTADMPDRPCRVICSHIDHDTVVGPTAYGKHAAITAWNTRSQSHSIPGDVGTEPMRADEWGLYGIGFDSHTGGFSSVEARKNGPEPKETVVFVKHEILAALTPSALSGDAGEGE